MSAIANRMNSAMGKAVGVAVLALLMMIPLSQLRALIAERAELQLQAQSRIASGIGGPQRIAGPVLSVPIDVLHTVTDEATHSHEDRWTPAPALRLLPRTLDINAELVTELRHKGIYSLPTYVARLRIVGVFDRRDIAATVPQDHGASPGAAAQRVQRERATLLLALGELKSLRAIRRLELAGQHLEASPGSFAERDVLVLPINLAAVLASDTTGDLPFNIDVEVTGSEALQFLPLAGTTSVHLYSDWPHPDFQGAFLPLAKSFEPKGGFNAQWSVLQLNRAIPRAWYGDAQSAVQFAAASFGVRLMQPSTVYSSNERAVRYGILFIAITFLGFFAWEHVTSTLRLHAMHYLLVGLALAVFYLLLTALSEHLGFALAYVIAAAALVLLIGLYVAGITGRAIAATLVAGMLAISYGLLYVILQSEDYALLLGSLLVFATLAALMLTTRRLDWSRVGGARPETAPMGGQR